MYNQQCLRPETDVMVTLEGILSATCSFQQDCTTAVFGRLLQHLMISGYVMIGVIAFNIIALLLSIFVINNRYRTSVE